MLTDDEVKVNVAANVRRLLEDRNLNQKQLAHMTGDSEMTISSVCRGLHTPGSGVLSRIAEALDVNVDRLMAPPPKISRKAS